ncbi:MAG: primosomal protein N' [Ichthyobacteriaceae bacterium]|nr:primosomal protein N' [Ichthyobacteriaceae bacterium]
MSSDNQKYFADIIVPVSIEQTFTYECTADDFSNIELGSRVVVQFGKSKYYTGIVFNKHNVEPFGFKPKFIEQILDEKPIVNTTQLKLWQWVADYYMSSLGEVYRNVVPSSLKLESETKLLRNPDFTEDLSGELTDAEYLVYEALNYKNALTVAEVSGIISKKNPLPIIKTLIEKGVILPVEEIKDRYKPKVENYIRFTDLMEEEGELQKVFSTLGRAKKQYELLLKFISVKTQTQQAVKVKDLLELANASRASLNGLADKEILEIYSEEVSRLVKPSNDLENQKTLSVDQLTAYDEIKSGFEKYDTVLFQGVTSSGKTEVYVKLIQEQLELNKQVLFLVPEIALTTQLINRLVKYFGEKIGVYHSKFNASERVEVWNTVNEHIGKYQIVLGPRSALFLPFSDLGLIIVDEEHESTFKQYDPAPRYNARDMSIVLAYIHKAKVLLGSATPSLESVFNVKNKKYGYVALDKRYGNILMPKIEIADIKEDHQKKKMRSHFGERLFLEMEETLLAKKQIILFQNRRGFAPVVECETCGTTPECPHCDVSLTFHKNSNHLKCHYCGYSIPMIRKCQSCGSPKLDTKGLGTEQIEDEVLKLFPGAIVARLDLDTTRKKYAYQDIIMKFENREIDILIGTQMVTKGLDFDNVALVGVLNADSMLNFPDFRAHEKAYQLMSQVAGRSGRKGDRGKVIIQTFNPYHQIIQQVSRNDFSGMVKDQLYDRSSYYYPPYYRLIKITLKHKDKAKLDKAAFNVAESLRGLKGAIVLGPDYPSVARIRNLYNKVILIKTANNKDLGSSKLYVKRVFHSFNEVKEYRSIRVVIDVDPY